MRTSRTALSAAALATAIAVGVPYANRMFDTPKAAPVTVAPAAVVGPGFAGPTQSAGNLVRTTGPTPFRTASQPTGSPFNSTSASGSPQVPGSAGGSPINSASGSQGSSPSGPSGSSPSGSPSGAPAGEVGTTIVGNQILTPSGAPFEVHGVNRPSLEFTCTGLSLSRTPGIPSSDFANMRDSWNANTVRIPLNEVYWLAADGVNTGTRACPGYHDTVARAVAAARAAGLAVILDLHWSDGGDTVAGKMQQWCMPDKDSVRFWSEVAAAYSGDLGVWFDPYNEPHDVTWSQWQNGGTNLYCGKVNATQASYVGMQTLVDTIRAQASNIILVGGRSWASTLGSLPLLSGSNLGYSIHPYETVPQPTNQPLGFDWNGRFGNLAATHVVVATEFGHRTCSTDVYDTAIMQYFISHHIGFTAWAYWASGCGFPALLDSSGRCVNGGCLYQQVMVKLP